MVEKWESKRWEGNEKGEFSRKGAKQLWFLASGEL